VTSSDEAGSAGLVWHPASSDDRHNPSGSISLDDLAPRLRATSLVGNRECDTSLEAFRRRDR
jgi:hypothetical protein